MFDPYHKWLGIPKEHRPPTLYQLLGIAADETDKEVIEEAAIRQTTHVRAYQVGPHAEDSTRLLNEISQARTTLLHPAKRKEYDVQLARTQAAAGAHQVAAGAPKAPTLVRAFAELEEKESNSVLSRSRPARAPELDMEQPNNWAAGKLGMLIGFGAGGVLLLAALVAVLISGGTGQELDQIPVIAKMDDFKKENKGAGNPVDIPNPIVGKPVLLPVGGNDIPIHWESGGAFKVLSCDASSAGVSPDDKYLVLLSEAGAVVVDAETGRFMHRLADAPPACRGPVFYLQGRSIAANDWDGRICFWDLADGRMRHRLGAPNSKTGIVHSFAVAPDNLHVLTGENDPFVRLWNLETGQETGRLSWQQEEPGEGGPRAKFTPDGRYAITNRRHIRVWDWRKITLHRLIKFDSKLDMSAAVLDVHPNNRWILAGAPNAQSGNLRLFDLETGELVHMFGGHPEDYVQRVAISRNGKYAASASCSKIPALVKVWDLEQKRELASVSFGKQSINNLQFCFNDEALLLTGSDVRFVYWKKLAHQVGTDRPPGQDNVIYKAPPDQGGSFRHILVTPDGRRAAWTTVIRRVVVWDLPSNQALLDEDLDGFVGEACSLSNDGQFMAVSVDKRVYLYDVKRRHRIKVLEHAARVQGLAFSHDAKILASASGDFVRNQDGTPMLSNGRLKYHSCELRFFESATGQQLSQSDPLEMPFTYLSFTARGDLLGSNHLGFRKWNPKSANEVDRVMTENYLRHTISPDGTQVLSTRQDHRTIVLWNLASNQVIREIPSERHIEKLVCSADGRTAISCDQTSLSIWDIENGRRHATLENVDQLITAMAISADGKLILTGGHGGVIRRWDFEKLKLAAAVHPKAETAKPGGNVVAADDITFEWSKDGNMKTVHPYQSVSAGVTPEGKHLVLFDNANPIVFDAESGKFVRRLAPAAVNAVPVFYLNGEGVAAGGRDLFFWDLQSGNLRGRLTNSESHIRFYAIAPDDNHVLTGSGNEPFVRIWNLETGIETGRLAWEQTNGGGKFVKFTPDGRYVVTGSRHIHVWDWPKRALRREIRFDAKDDATVSGLDVHPNGKWILASGSTKKGNLRLFDLVTGKVVYVFEGHPPGQFMDRVAISRDGNFAASASANEAGRVVKVWDLTKKREVASVDLKRGFFGNLQFCLNDEVLLVAGEKSDLVYWKKLAGPPGALKSKRQDGLLFKAPNGDIRHVALAADGRRAAWVHGGRAITVWDMETDQAVWSTSLDTFVGGCFGISPQGTHVAVADSKKKCLLLYKVGDDGPPLELAHASHVASLAFSDDGQLATGSGEYDPVQSPDCFVRIWHVATGKLRVQSKPLPAPVDFLRFVKGGHVLAGSHYHFRRVNAKTGDTVFFRESQAFLRHNFSSDGLRVLSTRQDNRTIVLWDLVKNQVLREIPSDYVAVRLVWSADGRTALSYERSHLLAWSIENGRRLATFDNAHGADISSVAISADGKFALSAGNDGAVRYWDLDALIKKTPKVGSK
ncbi:MAG: WD40 repeat domain-containing protein [Gemmataceae bacterium]|nr:WD40 repeat domain-containing protein [Gemmataceae bacterium]